MVNDRCSSKNNSRAKKSTIFFIHSFIRGACLGQKIELFTESRDKTKKQSIVLWLTYQNSKLDATSANFSQPEVSGSLPEKRGHVMVLQDGPVVVEQGEARGRVDVEIVRRARMVEVVNDGRHQRGEDLEVGHPILKKGTG